MSSEDAKPTPRVAPSGLERAMAKIDGLKRMVAAREAKVAQARVDRENLKAMIEGRERKIAEMRAEALELRKRLAAHGEMIASRDRKIAELERRSDQLGAKAESARSIVEERDEKILRLRQQLERRAEEAKSLHDSVKQLRAKTESLKKMVVARDEKNARLRQQLEHEAHEIKRLSRDFDRLKAQSGITAGTALPKPAERLRGKTTPESHVVICGLPRSGSALLHNMIRASSDGLVLPAHEASAGKLIGSKGDVVTKRPKDVFGLEDVLAANVRHKDIRLVLMIRDPRAVLVSADAAYPHQSFIGHDHSLMITPEVLSNVDTGLIEFIEEIDRRGADQTLPGITVRFEDLLRNPAAVRARLAAHTGLRLNDDFERLHEAPMPEALATPADGLPPLLQSRIFPWKSGAGAARVVRQFRLAPRLFETLESWGYEKDRRWYDELAEIAPAGLDDTRGLIVGFYTDDEIYRREAERLEISARRLGLPLELTRIPPASDWLAAVRFKVGFLSEMRRRHRGRLLYVDVDAVFHSDPWPHLNGYDADVAFSVPPNGRARSGTLLLADSPGAARFLEDWAARMAAAPEAWDQHPLNDVVREHRQLANPPYRVNFLPPELCYVFDSGVKGEPIIEHLQASREGRTESETALERLERRRKRVEEVDQIFFE